MSPLAEKILVLMKRYQRDGDGLFWTRMMIINIVLSGENTKEEVWSAIDELIEAGLVVRGDCELRLRRDDVTP